MSVLTRPPCSLAGSRRLACCPSSPFVPFAADVASGSHCVRQSQSRCVSVKCHHDGPGEAKVFSVAACTRTELKHSQAEGEEDDNEKTRGQNAILHSATLAPYLNYCDCPPSPLESPHIEFVCFHGFFSPYYC